jgi:hypothetical protein
MGPAGPAFALGAKLVLAAVLVGAGIAKLAARVSLPDALVTFGVPSRWSVPAARMLPAVELLLAGALVAFAGSAVPAYVAVGVLAAFTLAIVRALPARVPCPCFGAADSRPASWGSVARNLALVGVALLGAGSVDGVGLGGAIVATASLGAAVALVSGPWRQRGAR